MLGKMRAINSAHQRWAKGMPHGDFSLETGCRPGLIRGDVSNGYSRPILFASFWPNEATCTIQALILRTAQPMRICIAIVRRDYRHGEIQQIQERSPEHAVSFLSRFGIATGSFASVKARGFAANSSISIGVCSWWNSATAQPPLFSPMRLRSGEAQGRLSCKG